MQDIFIQSKVIDIFPKFKMAAAAILDFQFVWIWPLRRVASVVFVFCTKFGSNIFYGKMYHDGWAVTFATARRAWAGSSLAQSIAHCTKSNSAPINGQHINFILYTVFQKK